MKTSNYYCIIIFLITLIIIFSFQSKNRLYAVPRDGFGNILFIYLAGKSLAKKYNLEFKFTTSYDGNRENVDKYSLFSNLSSEPPPSNCTRINEKEYKYYPLVLENNNNNYLLFGYFQSYKHSLAYFDEIKTELFDNIKSQYNRIQGVYKSLIHNGETQSIMLHVRRGDYLNLEDIHPIQPTEYYKKALNVVFNSVRAKKYKILLFSDDIEFLKSWDLVDTLKMYKGVTYDIVYITDTVDTFLLMSMCDHFIIANSSFSLLSYYFRENKNAKLCAPSNWFGSKGPNYSMGDFVNVNDKNITIL